MQPSRNRRAGLKKGTEAFTLLWAKPAPTLGLPPRWRPREWLIVHCGVRWSWRRRRTLWRNPGVVGLDGRGHLHDQGGKQRVAIRVWSQLAVRVVEQHRSALVLDMGKCGRTAELDWLQMRREQQILMAFINLCSADIYIASADIYGISIRKNKNLPLLHLLQSGST